MDRDTTMTDHKIVRAVLELAQKKHPTPIVTQYLVRLRTSHEYDWVPLTVVRGFCYDHNFAKAFWDGKSGYAIDMSTIPKNMTALEFIQEYEKKGSEVFKKYNVDAEALDEKKEWEFHLQQMVLEENPIQYLKKFL